MADQFNEAKVAELRSQIITEFDLFQHDSMKTDNKAGSRRARQASLRAEKLMKEYRKLSIK